MAQQNRPCWQYLVRQKNLESDLKRVGITPTDMSALRVSDFKFRYVAKKERQVCQQIKQFITIHEWLGTMPHHPTHRFIATYQGHMAGVVVMSTPNMLCSQFFGPQNRDREKLISRGACISWSPKNLASALLMDSIRWMAKNTPYRFFTGYSDVGAGEIGTIYQACNFIYLGQKMGEKFKYYDPQSPDRGWFSERIFAKTSKIKRCAKACGIHWQSQWQQRDKIFWDAMPPSVESKIRGRLKEEKARCMRKKVPRKHKYVYILATNRRETKRLRQSFFNLRRSKLNHPYPSRRTLASVA